MRSIDFLAIGCAIVSLVAFVSSSSAFQIGRPVVGTLKLIVGALLLILGVGAGAAAIGTEGHQPLTEESTLVASAVVTGSSGDSLTARVTWPDGISRTFELAGTRVRFDVRVVTWKRVGSLLGASRQWEFSGLAGESADGETPVGSARDLRRSRPVSLYELVQKYPTLSTLLEVEQQSVAVRAGAPETELHVSTHGLTTGN